mgnify:CR=1 FL=1
MVGCDATFRSEADRWFTSAVEAEDTRDRTAARLHAQRAVHSDPQHTGALALLGLCQIRDGDRHSGRVSQHLAAQLAPDDPNVLHFVGVGSWEREDGRQAIETLSRAVELDSPHPSSVPVLAQILELSNQTAEAQNLLDRFAVSDPASQLLRARLLRRSGACGEALEVLDRIDPSAEGADPRLIHAERARCFDLGDHAEEAWEQVTFANEIAAQRSHHSPISPWFDRLSTVQRRRGPRRGSAATDAEPLEAGSWAGPTAFVVGFPRSGTTLIESLLTSAPGVTSTREVEAIGQAVAQVGAAVGTVDFSAHHKQTTVGLLGHIVLIQRRPEARPTRAGIELAGRAEKRVATGGAMIRALALVVVVFTGKGRLGPFLAQDVELLRRQKLTPFCFGLDNGRRAACFRSGSCGVGMPIHGCLLGDCPGLRQPAAARSRQVQDHHNRNQCCRFEVHRHLT